MSTYTHMYQPLQGLRYVTSERCKERGVTFNDEALSRRCEASPTITCHNTHIVGSHPPPTVGTALFVSSGGCVCVAPVLPAPASVFPYCGDPP